MTLASDTARAARDVAWMIDTANQTGKVFRPTRTGDGTFDGGWEPTAPEVGDIPVEMRPQDAKDLEELKVDGLAKVKPDADVEVEDFIEIAGRRYRVREKKEHRLFGTLTHYGLHLEIKKQA